MGHRGRQTGGRRNRQPTPSSAAVSRITRRRAPPPEAGASVDHRPHEHAGGVAVSVMLVLSVKRGREFVPRAAPRQRPLGAKSPRRGHPETGGGAMRPRQFIEAERPAAAPSASGVSPPERCARCRRPSRWHTSRPTSVAVPPRRWSSTTPAMISRINSVEGHRAVGRVRALAGAQVWVMSGSPQDAVRLQLRASGSGTVARRWRAGPRNATAPGHELAR